MAIKVSGLTRMAAPVGHALAKAGPPSSSAGISVRSELGTFGKEEFDGQFGEMSGKGRNSSQ
jgi:hypothetical protein